MLATPSAIVWIIPAPGIPKLTTDFPDSGMRSLAKATDPNYFKQIRFWKTPLQACGDSRGNTCTDYSEWTQKWTDIKGKVTEVQWLNPHVWVYLDTKDAKGETVQWALEGGQRSTLERLSAEGERARIKAVIVQNLKTDRGAGDPKNVVIVNCGFDRTLAGKNLADLTRDELIMVNEAVRAERAAGRPAWDTQREAPLAEHRHARFIEMAHLVELAGFNQFQCIQDFCRRYQICGADLIVLTPFGRPPRTDRGRAGRRRLSLSCFDDADPVDAGRRPPDPRRGRAGG